MARLNLEDGLFKDARFTELAIQLGSRRAALGALVEAFMVAQKYWVAEQSPIPLDEFKKQRLAPELVEVGLAEERDGGFYIAGSKEQFAWLVQRSESGRKGGVSSGVTRSKRNEAKRSETKRGEAYAEAGASGANPLPLSSFLSSPFSDSGSSSSSLKNTRAPSAAAPVQEFIAGYCEAYKAKFGTNPVIDGKAAGAAKRVLKAMGAERAAKLAQTYLDWNDPWFVKRGHDLTTFADNLNRIAQKHDTGRVITQAGALKSETDDFYRDQLEQVRRGEI